MKKKTYRKAELERTICSSSDNPGKGVRGDKEIKHIKKTSKYMKLGGSGSGSTRTKVSSKPNSSSRQGSNPSHQNSLLKLRRGSNLTDFSNHSMRYGSIEDMKRRNTSSKESLNSYNSAKRPQKCGVGVSISNKANKNLKDTSIVSSLSKNSLKENIKMNFSNSQTPMADYRRTLLSNCDSGTIKNQTHIMSNASIGSHSSAGSSTLSVIKGLKEVNKVFMAKNFDPRNEANKDSISLPSSSQLNSYKKPSKKKPAISKNSLLNTSKRACKKVLKTNRKTIRKPASKFSVTSAMPKVSYQKASKTSSDRRHVKKALVSKITATKRNKVMKKLSNQINKHLNLNSNSSEIQPKTSPGKKVSISSSRKKPPLVKATNSGQAAKMLRYPSNISNQRNTSISVKSSNSMKQMVLPSKTKSKNSSLRRADNDSNRTLSESGEPSIGVPNIKSCINTQILNENLGKKEKATTLKNDDSIRLLGSNMFVGNRTGLQNYINPNFKNAKNQNKRYESECDQENEYSLSQAKLEDIVVDNPVSASRTPATTKQKSRIYDLEEKENIKFLDHNEKFENVYHNQRKKQKQMDEELYEYLKESQLESQPEPNFPMGETKTQNTQDYRKDNDLGIDDINFNFSAEKAVQKFTRFEICSEFEDKDKPSETDCGEIPDEFSRRYTKNMRMVNRYTPGIKEEEKETPEPEQETTLEIEQDLECEEEKVSIPSNEQGMSQSNLLLSENDSDGKEKNSSSNSINSCQKENINKFLRGSRYSMELELSHNKEDPLSKYPNCEISYDNPMEIDSKSGSKLELADLQVKKSIQDLTEPEFETKKDFSRNEEKYLSSSSICNFKSLDVTDRSVNSSAVELYGDKHGY